MVVHTVYDARAAAILNLAGASRKRSFESLHKDWACACEEVTYDLCCKIRSSLLLAGLGPVLIELNTHNPLAREDQYT